MNSASLATGSVPRWSLLALLVAGGLLVPVLFACRPTYGLLGLLASTTMLSYHSFLSSKLRTIHIPDLLFALMFGILFYHALSRRSRLRGTSLAKPGLYFAASACLSFAYGVLIGHANAMEAVREFRVFFFYLLFIPVASFIPDLKTLKAFITGCLAVGALAAINLLLGALFKPPALNADDLDVYYGFAELTGGNGLVLVYICLCCCLALAVVHRVAPAGVAATGLYLLFFLLRFHRHMYIAIALAILLCLALTYSTHRQRVLRIVSLAVVLAFVGGSAVVWGPKIISRFADLSLKRALSLHGIKSTSTVTLRLRENDYAIMKIKDNPLIGIGFARSYRPSLYNSTDTLDRFIHNGYLWLMLKMGIVGVAAFTWFCGTFVRRGLTRWRSLRDPFLKGTVLGTTVAFLGLAVCNMTAPYFMGDWNVAAIGIIFGINEAAYRCDPEYPLPGEATA
jgi:hypothetical protein